MINNQLNENRVLKINLQLPEIQREAKVLRVKNELLANVTQEIWSTKLELKEVENDFIQFRRHSDIVKHGYEQQMYDLKYKYDVEDLKLEELVK